MIEDEKAAGNHEDHLGQLQFIAFRHRNFGFEEVDCFVAEEANSAAAESRQFRTRNKLISRHQFLEFIQWVACYVDPPLDSRFRDLQLTPEAFYHHPRIDSYEGETSRSVVFLSRFEQETVTAAV